MRVEKVDLAIAVANRHEMSVFRGLDRCNDGRIEPVGLLDPVVECAWLGGGVWDVAPLLDEGAERFGASSDPRDVGCVQVAGVKRESSVLHTQVGVF